jgi:hypothetical protein
MQNPGARQHHAALQVRSALAAHVPTMKSAQFLALDRSAAQVLLTGRPAPRSSCANPALAALAHLFGFQISAFGLGLPLTAFNAALPPPIPPLISLYASGNFG